MSVPEHSLFLKAVGRHESQAGPPYEAEAGVDV
jgi:hypothetical protein